MSSFPSPIGGIALSSDLIPSIIFSTLFFLLYPFMIYKTIRRKSRTILFLSTLITLAERPIVFIFRANQSQKIDWQNSHGWLKYMQLSFTLGYVNLSQDLPKMLRAHIVNASYPPEGAPGEVDHPKIRHLARRGLMIFDYAYFGALIPGILSSFQLSETIGNEDKGDSVMAMRYASAGVTLYLNLVLLVWALVVSSKISRMDRKATRVFLTLCSILCIPAIYRLAVMHNRTEGDALSLSPDTPGSLNGPKDKAFFYAFHIVPEAITGAMCFVLFNVRELFKSGFLGDTAWRDYTPEEKAKQDEAMQVLKDLFCLRWDKVRQYQQVQNQRAGESTENLRGRPIELERV